MKKKRVVGKKIYSSSQEGLLPLGSAEKAVMGLLHQGITGSRQIASRQGFSKRRANQIMASLRKKGYIGVSIPTIPKTEVTREDHEELLERHNIHALRLRVHVHWMHERYKNAPNQFYEEFHGVRVDCHHRYILVETKGQRFYGVTPEKALWNSLGFFKRLIRKLENRLGVVILKDGSCAFEVLYAEWEEGDATEAIDAERRGTRWMVFHPADGKLRVTTDHSFSPSLEFHHVRDAYQDRTTWTKQVNAILSNPECPTMPELAKALALQVELSHETAAGMKMIVDLMKPKDQSETKMPDGWRPDYCG